MPSKQVRRLSAALRLVPDSALAWGMTHPVRFRRDTLAPRGTRLRHDVTEVEIHGHRVATARPRRGAGNGRHLFYLHGGAYTLQDQHWPFLELFVERGWTVTLVDYPLAPEHTVEETVPMTVAAWEHVTDLAHGARVDVAGDSAGGGLALVLLQEVKRRGLTPPGRTVLLSPWVDLVMSDEATIEAARDDVLLSHPGLLGCVELYRASRPATDPWLSPIHGDLADLGEIQAWVGTAEMFQPQCERLADLVAATPGTSLDLRLGHGLLHDWPLFPVPEREWLLEEMLVFLQA